MSNSIVIGGTDLATYKLVVVSHTATDFGQSPDYVQLLDKAYTFGAHRPAKTILLGVVVTGTSRANLEINLNEVKYFLNVRDTQTLILDVLSDRYFNAQFVSLTGRYQSPISFAGDLEFVCPDPLAYDNDLVSSNHNIDADPKTVTETTHGSGYSTPVYTLTAGEALTDVTIKLECVETAEELQWVGSLANTDVLVVDSTTWLVTKEGAASMATVTGQFPRLIPGGGVVAHAACHVKVTGFSTTGTLNIAYRDTYV